MTSTCIFKNLFFENDLDVEKRVNINIELI